MFKRAVFSALALSVPLNTFARTFTIVNSCTQDIDLYISGKKDSTLAKNGGKTQKKFDNNFAGTFYTDAMGGKADGSSATQAGFVEKDGLFYIVQDAEHFNTAISIVPNAARNGRCGAISCLNDGCPLAYTSSPSSFTTQAPFAPLNKCDNKVTEYVVTFCPTDAKKTFVNIHPNGDEKKCLDVSGAKFENGTPVQIYDCNGTDAQKWEMNTLCTGLKTPGGAFSLDTGTDARDGNKMKIWKSYDNLAAQSWWFEANRIINGDNLCLDLTDGKKTNGNRMQVWTCADGNKNQIWTISEA